MRQQVVFLSIVLINFTVYALDGKTDVGFAQNKIAGSRLDFRVLPNGVGSSLYPISPFELPKYIENLKKNGPEYGNDYVWLPMELKVGKEHPELIKQEYNGRMYVLASNKQNDIMLGNGSWSITFVDRKRDGNVGNFHSITARFDEYGQHSFSSLTERHHFHLLAIVRNGKVIYAAPIKRKMCRATIAGDFTEKQTANLMYIFKERQRPWQDPPPFLGNLDRPVWNDYVNICEDLRAGKDRAKLADTFLRIGQKYPQTTHCQIAAEVGDLLRKMSEEDKHFKEPETVDGLNLADQIAYYIYKLRDLSEQEITVPGKIRFLGYGQDAYEQMDTPAAELRKMGREALPALIETINDRRPTRSVGNLMNGGAITRNCDVALEIIESITSRKFDYNRGRGSYLSTAGEKLANRIVADVKQWWNSEQNISHSSPSSEVPAEIKIAMESLRALLIELSSEYPEMIDAKNIRIKGSLTGSLLYGFDYFHDCKDWGKLGHEETGPNAVHVGFIITTLPPEGGWFAFECTPAARRWPYLNLVAWTHHFTGKNPTPGLSKEIKSILQQTIDKIDELEIAESKAKGYQAVEGLGITAERPVAKTISLEEYLKLKEEYIQKHERPGDYTLSYREKHKGNWRSFWLMLDGFDDSYVYVGEVIQYKSKGWDWIRRYKLKRSAQVDRELKITQIIKKRSQVIGGVKYGMSVKEVLKIKGKPDEVIPHAKEGSEDWIYDDVRISLWGHYGDDGAWIRDVRAEIKMLPDGE